MEPSNGTVWNDGVYVGKWREIAARGVTPNHIGSKIKVNGDDVGRLVRYEHFNTTTVLTTRLDENPLYNEFDLKHLNTIQFAS